MPSKEPIPASLPPLDPWRLVAVREQLGLTIGQVAWAVAAFRGRPLHPTLLTAWEQGAEQPDPDEITALAAALWCAPADLVGEPRSLLQCRTLAGLTLAEAAAAARMPHHRYAEAEARNRWRGTAEQTAGMVRALRPPPAVYVTACGLTGRVRITLREAVTGWWPNHLGALRRIVPVDGRELESALGRLHHAYQKLQTQAEGRSGAAAEAADRRAAAFLDRIDEHLWEVLRQSAA
ncbi:helix-turn-helix domain-containing protein [Streptomyces sp. NPDC048603]|uniref:helix-turn-helix domain-containing protein n=1 Tax=Streptomyces sp. NPDC048603 TaxID=3365577 RepID=UPI00371E0CBA